MVSTVPVLDINKALLHGLRHHGYRGYVVLTAHTLRDAYELQQAGADMVLEPFAFAATTTANALADAINDRELWRDDDDENNNS